MVFPAGEMRRRNPYYHLAMVRDPQMFFGRQGSLRQVYGAIYDQQCLSLIGARRIGKSSLLEASRQKEVQERFGYDLSAYILTYIDTGEQPQKSYEDFLGFIGQQCIAQNQERLAPLQERDTHDVDEFRHFLEEIKELGLHPVLLMDEFENIAGAKQFEPGFFHFLRAQANAGKISYITASKDTLDKICHEDLVGSPFFNIFSTHKLGPLARNEALELISVPAQREGVGFSAEEVEWVLKMAGRHPFFIQRTCYFLFEGKSQQGEGVELHEIEEQVYAQLVPHFRYAWNHLDKETREQLAWEARRNGVAQRRVPELSESLLFRKFVCEECSIDAGEISAEYLDGVLDRIDDVQFLGESTLGYLNIVYLQMKGATSTAVERGLVVQRILLETIEELRPVGGQKRDEAQLRFHQILSWRHKDGLRNEEIAARLAITTRHFFRERIKAVKALLTILLMKEARSKEELGSS